MGKQTSLFEDNEIELKIDRTSVNIVISDLASKKDEKKRLLIRKHLNSIEKQKTVLKNLKKTLNETNVIFQNETRETNDLMLKTKEKLALKFFTRFKESGFTKWQKDLLAKQTSRKLEELTEEDYDSEVIENIRREWAEIEAADETPERTEEKIEIVKNLLIDMGITDEKILNSVDSIDFADPEGLDNFMKKIVDEQREKYAHEFNEKNIASDKSAISNNSDFKSLYKKLAKSVHPDLAKNEEERLEKEVLMKRISEAYSSQNFLELLMLEKEINKTDVNTDIVLDKSQLDSIVEQLKKELEDLRYEIEFLKHGHDHYSFLYEEIYSKSEKKLLNNIKEHLFYLEDVIEEDKESLENLKTKKSTKFFLEDLRAFEADFQNFLFDSVFDDF